jgi:hypothetical protein
MGSGSSMSSSSMSGSTTTKKKKKKATPSAKSSLARHGPPIDAAGANSGSSSNPASGPDIPSTTGAKATKPQ